MRPVGITAHNLCPERCKMPERVNTPRFRFVRDTPIPAVLNDVKSICQNHSTGELASSMLVSFFTYNLQKPLP